MKRLSVSTAVLAIWAAGATAQTNTFTVPNNVMGKVVKGAPYSADEITESLQVLADGTRISNQSTASVYRDSEGRVRRETDKAISIWDPVENVTYELNKNSMKGARVSMARTYESATKTVTTASGVTFTLSPPSADLQAGASQSQAQAMALLDKLKAEAQAQGMVVNGSAPDPIKAAFMKEQLDAAMSKLSEMAAAQATLTRKAPTKAANTESLGQQVMQGLTADGTRTTVTIEVGAIGNDRPINVVSERWYSPELQTVVMTKHSDPRSGEETFQLSNVRRGEPGADLFLLPPGYDLKDSGKKIILSPKKDEHQE
jgi:hypothetical protein